METTLEYPTGTAYVDNLSRPNYLDPVTVTGTSIHVKNKLWHVVEPIQETRISSEEEKYAFALLLKLKKELNKHAELFQQHGLKKSFIAKKFFANLAHMMVMKGENIEFSLSEELIIQFSLKHHNTLIYVDYFLEYDKDDIDDEEVIITLDIPDTDITSYGGELYKCWNHVYKILSIV